jgi:hypothetical protein
MCLRRCEAYHVPALDGYGNAACVDDLLYREMLTARRTRRLLLTGHVATCLTYSATRSRRHVTLPAELLCTNTCLASKGTLTEVS